ncbi:chaplin [Yinghuangia soli]|uniref:Chaplin n=1 Tax=Yinghuangia soli TaxID=2908204 RepID=A0AA41Q7N8_9ACTN|nr:chaplin [Yinghuangia soli]MCF2533103.1 chaplin [Yinghuangia soli]
MNNIKKAAVLAAVAGGVVAAGAGAAHASTEADGAAVGSPGVASGNVGQLGVHVPVNVCGNSVDVIAALNPAFGNTCMNAG